jgi:hypothetical protein
MVIAVHVNGKGYAVSGKLGEEEERCWRDRERGSCVHTHTRKPLPCVWQDGETEMIFMFCNEVASHAWPVGILDQRLVAWVCVSRVCFVSGGEREGLPMH